MIYKIKDRTYKVTKVFKGGRKFSCLYRYTYDIC